MARRLKGHSYLFVPIPLTWEAALAWCQERGGHLATIASAEENALVGALLSEEEFTWIGLAMENGRCRWVTGEPLRFEAFPDWFSKRLNCAFLLYREKWRVSHFKSDLRPFVIEWDQ